MINFPFGGSWPEARCLQLFSSSCEWVSSSCGRGFWGVPSLQQEGSMCPGFLWGSVLGLSISQLPAQRSQAGKGILGRAVPWRELLQGAPNHQLWCCCLCSLSFPQSCSRWCFSVPAGEAGWGMAVRGRNLPVLRAGGQMFPCLIAQWGRKYWVWTGIVDSTAKKTSPVSYKPVRRKSETLPGSWGHLVTTKWDGQVSHVSLLSQLRGCSEVPTVEGKH